MKRREIAVVDADDLRSRAQRALQLIKRVHFDERIEMIRRGRVQKIDKVFLIESRDDQKNRIRARRARLRDLNFIENKILSQKRNVGHSPNGQ